LILMSDTPTTALMPSELAPLSDAPAVEILEFHELIVRFEAHCFAQIRRFYHQQLDLFDDMQPTRVAPPTNEDVPF